MQNMKIFSKNRKKIIIIGAGNSSEKIIREIRDNASLKYLVVGLVDDDNKKRRYYPDEGICQENFPKF